MKITSLPVFIVALLLLCCCCYAQRDSLTIEQCYDLAKKNYPLVKKYNLLDLSNQYNIENARKGYLPQLSFSGQASYQSDVTAFPNISIPGIHLQFPAIPKDQYKIYADVNQTLFDGGVIKQQVRIQGSALKIDKAQLETDLYAIKDRINQLFFSIILIGEQLKQNALLTKDLTASLNKINAGIKNGTAFRADADQMQAEILKAEQAALEMKATRKAYSNMLGSFLGLPSGDSLSLSKPAPAISTPSASIVINRPELAIFDAQKNMFDAQGKLILSRTLPKFSLFGQGGYGKPNPVNILKPVFDWYYIGGIRFNWNIGGFYTFKREHDLLNINKQMAEVQRETFLFNTSLTLKQQDAQEEKLLQMIENDKKIIALRTSVKAASKAKYENGVETTNDYIKDVDAESQALLDLSLHQIQLLNNRYSKKTTSGN